VSAAETRTQRTAGIGSGAAGDPLAQYRVADEPFYRGVADEV